MYSQTSKGVEVIDCEIAIADGIKAIGRYARKAQFFGQPFSIDGERAAAQRPRTKGTRVRHFSSGTEPV